MKASILATQTCRLIQNIDDPNRSFLEAFNPFTEDLVKKNKKDNRRRILHVINCLSGDDADFIDE